MAKEDINGWQGYTVEDCDCQYCLYYGGRHKRKVVCLAETCVCQEERREAAKRQNKHKENKE